MKTNEAYCPLFFNEIYNDSSGEYRFCCHASTSERKFTMHTHTPFEYFNSEFMEEKRNSIMEGKKTHECRTCYEQEEATGVSHRTEEIEKYKKWMPTSVDKIQIKLRINGTYCNLSCYMCAPYNSSTRRNEMKEVYPEGWKWWQHEDYVSLKSKQWERIVDSIIENIDKVSVILMTGGEPLLLPNHWKLLDRITDEHAKNIRLTYNTNFTELQYKKHHARDVHNKFKSCQWIISCDHYGEKLAYIRYPIDVKKFENNLLDTTDFNDRGIQVSVSILNIEDLLEIEEYYNNKFGIEVMFKSIVDTPISLSIRNLPDKKKEELIKLYEENSTISTGGTGVAMEKFSFVISELKQPGNPEDLKKGIIYMTKLSKVRTIDHAKLWPEYAAPKSNKISVLTVEDK